MLSPVLRASFILLLQTFRTTQDEDYDLSGDSPAHFPVKASILPPKSRDGGPVEVYIGFYIESMGSFSTARMTFDMDSYIYLSWQDERLAHDGSTKIINNEAELTQIWRPDLYFVNAKKTEFQYAITPNFALFILADGTVSYSVRVMKRLACDFALEEYPMDHQACMIRIMSYAYTTNEMLVRWFHPNPVTVNPKIKLTEFKVHDHIGTCDCNGSYKYQRTKKSQLYARFSCLTATIYLKRQITFHVVQTYLPTAMIVAISWVSFWIDRNAVPARVTLSFTTLLTLSTMSAGIRFGLPAVSYAKAIDYWIGCCMVFVFAALIQFAFVNGCSREASRHEGIAEKSKRIEVIEYNRSMCDLFTDKALKTDLVSRIVFPLLFLLFNIMYWLIYADVIGEKDYNMRFAPNLTCIA